MKFLASKFRINEQLKIWLLLIGLFVLLPGCLFFITESLELFIRKTGCIFTSWILVWLHIGLLLIFPLTKSISWKAVIITGIFFASCSIMQRIMHNSINDIVALSVFYNTYNSLYLFGIKGALETWRFRKEKRVILSILLTCPLLAILGITAFATFFFVINCF